MSSYKVNDLLHNLRGEHFRHAQNLRRSRTHVSSSITHILPTLPLDIDVDSPPSDYVLTNTAGPGPPKSWTLIRPILQDTPAWRSSALSLVVPVSPNPCIPTLTTLCLCILASVSAHEFTRDILPWLAPHLRRDLVRYTAVHAPLTSAKLWPLYEPDGHADAELIVVSPQAVLRDDYFIRSANTRNNDDWDKDGDLGVEPLSTLVLVSARLATSTLLSLPPTITRMALINLPAPIPLHRLPNACPQLVVLDLSYNSWLYTAEDSDKAFERVEWSRWSNLNKLGLRECVVSSTVRKKLNKGRWDDVEVVQ